MNVDYDIHGVLGLRLIDPTPSLAGLVARQLDPWRPSPLASEPDVSISRLRTVSSRGNRYRLGDAGDSQECEFSDSEFILRKGAMSLSLPFSSVGEGCVNGWSGGSGMRKLMIDYVRPALQISLLPKDRLALHSAAVAYEGKGILLAGWAESGKTEAMLGFLQAGAAFVSDKWTIVDGDGSTIRHFPTPIAVREADVPEVASRLADCAAYERRAFFGLYQRFRYAYPGRRNRLIEEAREAESRTLANALESKRVFVVEAPFPFDPSALYRAIQPFC